MGVNFTGIPPSPGILPIGLVGMLEDAMLPPPDDEPWAWPPYMVGSIGSELVVLCLLISAGLASDDDDDVDGEEVVAVDLVVRPVGPRRLVGAEASLSS